MVASQTAFGGGHDGEETVSWSIAQVGQKHGRASKADQGEDHSKGKVNRPVGLAVLRGPMPIPKGSEAPIAIDPSMLEEAATTTDDGALSKMTSMVAQGSFRAIVGMGRNDRDGTACRVLANGPPPANASEKVIVTFVATFLDPCDRGVDGQVGTSCG